MEWAYSTMSGSGVSLYRFGILADELVLHPSKMPAGGALSDIELTEEDARTQEMIGRLILNVCLAYDHSGTVKPPRRGLNPLKPTDKEPPPLAVFQLGRTLTLDCRESVRFYIMGTGDGKSPSIVSLVRGHWKNQVSIDSGPDNYVLSIYHKLELNDITLNFRWYDIVVFSNTSCNGGYMQLVDILKFAQDSDKPYKSKVTTIYQCCGKENIVTKGLALRTINKRGRYWCTKCFANSDEGKAQRSKQSRKAWDDPTYREINTEHNRRNANSEEGKLQRSIQSKNAWNNSDYRELQVNRTAEMFKSREHIEIVKDNNRKYYSMDPDRYISERVSVLHTPEARANHKKAVNKEEYREDHRKKALKRFESPEYKAKIAKGMANFPNAGKRSGPEQSLDGLLNRLSIPFIIEKEVGPYRFDTFIPSLNTYIEVHGEYWHGLEINANRDAAKSAYLMSTFPEAKLIVIYDYEFLSPGMVEIKIRNELGLEDVKTVDFEFGDLEYKMTKMEDARIFFNSHHYAQFGKLPKFVLGAYLNDMLIAAFKVAPVSRAESARKEGFNPKECYELDRFCIHPNYHKKNFASHFISKGLREFWQGFPSVKALISFADETQGHSGTIYKASGWRELGKIKPDYHYVDENGWKMHKKTLYNHARSAKLTERAWAELHNWKKVFGKSKTKFIIINPNR